MADDSFDFTTMFADGFSPHIAIMLECADAESYIPLFKKENFGLNVFRLFNDVDLMLLGVDCSSARTRILDLIKQLPESKIYDSKYFETEKLSKSEIAGILIDSKKHLHSIFLSLLSNRTSLLRMPNPEDVILQSTTDIHSTDLVLKVYNNIEEIIYKMELELNHIRDLSTSTTTKNKKRSKLLILSIGGTLITVLTMAFIKSLKSYNLQHLVSN